MVQIHRSCFSHWSVSVLGVDQFASWLWWKGLEMVGDGLMDGGNNLSSDWLLIGLWIINCLGETGYEDEDWLVPWCAPGPGVYRGAWARVFQLSCFQLRVERQAFRPRNVSYLTILSFFFVTVTYYYSIAMVFILDSFGLLIGTLFCSYVADEMIVVSYVYCFQVGHSSHVHSVCPLLQKSPWCLRCFTHGVLSISILLAQNFQSLFCFWKKSDTARCFFS